MRADKLVREGHDFSRAVEPLKICPRFSV
jgi:hypothetical protein